MAISYCVSAGNEDDLGTNEYSYMVQDASTDVILLFIEGIRDVDKFTAAARRAAVGKPVIGTKVAAPAPASAPPAPPHGRLVRRL